MTTETNTNTGEETETKQVGLPDGVKPSDTDQPVRDAGAPKGHKPEEKDTQDAKDSKEDSSSDEESKDKDTDADNKDKSDSDAATDNLDSEEIEYISYGDANADAVVDILKEANIPAQEAFNLFKEAADTGDMSKIDKSVLIEKLGQSKADLVMLGVEKYYTTHIQSVNETVTAVHNEAGGEANYNKVVEWARAKGQTDPEFQKQVDSFNQMFDLNKTAATIAARELVSLYNADDKNSSLSKTIVTGDNAVNTGNAQSEYISRADYLAKLKTAYDKNDNVAINNLRAQRQRSLKFDK